MTTENRSEGGQPILLHNRDGIGVRLKVITADVVHVQEVWTGSPLLSSNSPWLTFGLGDHDEPVDVAVKWPSGLTEVFEKQSIRQIVTLTEGTGTAK